MTSSSTSMHSAIRRSIESFLGGNGKIRFPNSRISLVYGCTIDSSSRIEFLHLINVWFFNHKRKILLLYKIISINVLIRSLINQIRKYIRNHENRNFFRLFVSWKYFKLSLKKKTRQSIQKNIISMMPSESYFICRNASIAMFDYRTTEK